MASQGQVVCSESPEVPFIVPGHRKGHPEAREEQGGGQERTSGDQKLQASIRLTDAQPCLRAMWKLLRKTEGACPLPGQENCKLWGLSLGGSISSKLSQLFSCGAQLSGAFGSSLGHKGGSRGWTCPGISGP